MIRYVQEKAHLDDDALQIRDMYTHLDRYQLRRCPFPTLPAPPLRCRETDTRIPHERGTNWRLTSRRACPEPELPEAATVFD